MRPLDQINNDFFAPHRMRDDDPREIRFDTPKVEEDLDEWCQKVKANRDRLKNLRAANKEVILHGVLMNEVDYVQFVGKVDDNGVPIRIYYWQAPMLLDDYVVAMAGRDCGKSFTMKCCIEHRMVNFYPTSMILTGADEWRVEKPWNELVMMEMRKSWWASQFFDTRDGASKTKMPCHQWFLTDSKLHGIAAGENKSNKVESPHVHCLVADEFQEYSAATWGKLMPAINDYNRNRVNGAMRKVFGNNSEGRIDIVFYDLAFRTFPYYHHRYTIPSWYNPAYTLDRHAEFLGLYDFSTDASKFKQVVRGLVGERSRGLIDQHAYAACTEMGEQMGLLRRRVQAIDRTYYMRKAGDVVTIVDSLDLDQYEGDYDQIVLSADYGSSAPTMIGIWYRVPHPEPYQTLPGEELAEERKAWMLFWRIGIEGISAQDQAPIVDHLARLYGVHFLSIDSTGGMNALAQILTDPRHQMYADQNYTERLFAAQSNKMAAIRYQQDEPNDKKGAPVGYSWRKVELVGQDGWIRLPVWAMEQHTNVLASHGVAHLIQHRHLILSPSDTELQQELLSITEHYQEGTLPKYKGSGGQGAAGLHRFSMMRSFALWYHKEYVIKPMQKKLLGEDDAAFGAQMNNIVQFKRIKMPEIGSLRANYGSIA